MVLHIGLVLIALTGATSSATDSGTGNVTTAEEDAQFDLMMKRRMEKRKIPPSAAGFVPATVAAASLKPELSFEEKERERAKEFDGQFEPGTYEGITGFSDRCKFADGCNKLATMNLIKGAYEFVDLHKEKLAPDSDAYRSRHAKIKIDIRSSMEKFHPQPGARADYEKDFLKFSDPIVKKVFSKDELLRYAERNASSSDSAPFYTYLGQALNGAGPPGKARAAFDAALQRDPKSDAALSGRAEARLNQGDYAGAVRDAVAALKLNPRNDHAYATLKFSEGRVPAESTGDQPGVPGAAAAAYAGAAPGGFMSAGGSPPSALGRAGGAVPFDSLRRSDTLVAEARRNLGLGDFSAAIQLLSKAVELNPSNVVALGLAAMAHIRLQNYPEALAAAEAGLKLAPNNGPLLNTKANALNYMKDYRGALAAADLAIAANPNDAMAHYNRAWALGGLHDREGSLTSLRTAAGLNPQFAPALDSALSLPSTDDIIYLFPGAKGDAQPVPVAADSGSGRPPWIALAGAAGAVGLILLLGARLRQRPPPPEPTVRRKAPKLLDGKFEVGREIGAGGMGMVYFGRDLSLDRVVAIKRMREEIRWDTRERARFIAEAKLVAKLKHPHIVEIHTIVEHDGEVYLIFEYVAGRTLQEVLAQEEKLRFEKARDLFRGVASALDYAQGHGVIHRDLKPANLMVDGEGRVRVMDFGIARLTQEAISRHSKTNTAVGTPLYMAPEQEQGVMRKESDAYSMALCLYEALTGRPPFAGTGTGLLMNKLKGNHEPPSKLDPRLPLGLDDVFKKALDPDPDKRYSTAGNLLRALEGLEATHA